MGSAPLSGFNFVQGILTAISLKLGASVGVQTVAVTSLSAAWSNYILIARAAISTTVSGFLPALSASIIRIQALTASLLRLSSP